MKRYEKIVYIGKCFKTFTCSHRKQAMLICFISVSFSYISIHTQLRVKRHFHTFSIWQIFTYNMISSWATNSIWSRSGLLSFQTSLNHRHLSNETYDVNVKVEAEEKARFELWSFQRQTNYRDCLRTQFDEWMNVFKRPLIPHFNWICRHLLIANNLIIVAFTHPHPEMRNKRLFH